ncbi:MAG: hypothetical protein D6775_03155 [Caldilineae bacterium]|nr:MAG: hypothetical protein D6775_03155 [Caldilineae bacterium]
MSLSLPEDLKKRLLEAGVQDKASLEAALQADDELRADYERWVIGLALHEFAQTTDQAGLRALVERMPFLLEEEMIRAIENAIAKALEIGDEGNADALAQRLKALRRLRAEQAEKVASQPMTQALIAFVQAPDDEAARAIFRERRDLLANQQAEALLFSHFEGQDSTAKLHLEKRRELFRRLLDEARGQSDR